jgi:hypothetical protein
MYSKGGTLAIRYGNGGTPLQQSSLHEKLDTDVNYLKVFLTN